MKLDIQPLDIQPLGGASEKGAPSLDLQPLDIQPIKNKRDATWRENLKAGWSDLKDLADKAISLPAGALAGVFSESERDRVFREMDARSRERAKTRLPEDVEQSFADKLATGLVTMPASILGASSASTGIDAIQAGESLDTARKMVGLDTAGNIAGLFLGPAGAGRLARAATGAGVNVAQDTAVRAGIVGLAETDEMKEKYAPTGESIALAATTGGAFGGLFPNRPTPKDKPKTMTDKLNNLEVQRPSQDSLGTTRVPEQLSLFDGDPSQGTRSPFNAGQGWDKWEFDENGIPIRKDLSVDVQNAGAGGALPGRMSQQGDLFDTPLGDLPPNKQSLLENDVEALKNQRLAQGGEQLSLDLQPPQRSLAEAADEQAMVRGAQDGQLDMFSNLDEQNTRTALLRSALDEPQTPREQDRRASNAEQTAGPRVNEGSTDGTVLPSARELPPTQTAPVVGQVSTLDSGLEKVRQGRSFDLTAEERIAVNNQGPAPEISRTPEAKRLSAEQLAERVRLREEARKAQTVASKEQARFEENGRDTMDGEGSSPIVPAGPTKTFPRMTTKRMGQTRYGRKQGGFIDFGTITDIFKKFKVAELVGKDVTGVMPDPSAKSVSELAKTEKGDYAANRYTGAGATLENMKAGGRAVIFAGKQIVQNWGKRTEAGIRAFVFPFEESIRRLNTKERIEMHQLFLTENQKGVRYTPEELAKAGFNDKQLRAHTRMREMFDMTLELQNEARRLRGERPITGEEAYVAHSWQGAFGRRVFDKNGNTVWVLRGDSRALLNRQVDKLLQKFPDLLAKDIKGPDGKIRPTAFDNLSDSRYGRSRDSNSLQSAYSTMVDLMGRDDPIVQAIAKFVEEESMKTAGNTMNQQAHFKEKQGVRGFDGDNPFASDHKNAVKFFEAQANYAKNAIKWAEVQKGMVNLKEIMSDPWIQENQPKTLKWLRDYVANDLGFGENKALRQFEDEIGRITGVSPQGLNNAIGKAKFLWVTQKLILSPGYIFANGFQLAMTVPFHLDLSNKGYKGNPVTSSAAGLFYGTLLASGHYGRGTHMKGFADVAQRSGVIPDYVRGAMEYAENNSVTNRSVYDETGVEPGYIGKVVQGTVSAPETFVRSMAYMSFVQHLKDSGMFEGKDRWQQMYQLAEDYTNAAMVDARQSEKAGIFSKTGVAGNMFNTLQSFTMNYFNQQSYFVREALRGNPLPLFASMGIQALLAGAMGLPFINDIDKAWETIKGWLPNSAYNKVKDWDIKMLMMENLGEAGTYGIVSDVLDVNMATRLQAPQLGEGLTMPGSMLMDIGKQIGGWFSALTGVDNEAKWAQAMLNSSPPGLKEALAQSPWMAPYTQSSKREDGTTPIFSRGQIEKRDATYTRTEKEQALARNFGLRSQGEVIEGDVNRWTLGKELELRERRISQMEKMYSKLRTEKDLKDFEDDITLFMSLGGTTQALEQGLLAQVENEFLTRRERNIMSAGDNIERIKRIKRIEDLLKQYELK